MMASRWDPTGMYRDSLENHCEWASFQNVSGLLGSCPDEAGRSSSKKFIMFQKQLVWKVYYLSGMWVAAASRGENWRPLDIIIILVWPLRFIWTFSKPFIWKKNGPVEVHMKSSYEFCPMVRMPKFKNCLQNGGAYELFFHMKSSYENSFGWQMFQRVIRASSYEKWTQSLIVHMNFSYELITLKFVVTMNFSYELITLKFVAYELFIWTDYSGVQFGEGIESGRFFFLDAMQA